jgi:hypothetical protein
MIDSREHPDGDREPFAEQKRELTDLLSRTYRTIIDHGGRPAETIALLARMEPFDAYPELVAALEEEEDVDR